MMISTKGRYALRIMIDLSIHRDEGFNSLRDVADRLEISMKYLELIVSSLHKANLVISKRGKTGGYSINGNDEDIIVSSVLKATEDGMTVVNCQGVNGNNCENKNECLTMPVWQELDNLIYDYLDNLTLKDIMDGNIHKHTL